jgi:hypothetical protein
VRSHIDRYVVANWVRMRGNRYRGHSCVIVEGDKDVRLFGNFVNTDTARLIPGDGKDNVIGALVLLEQGGWKGVIGIVDADFDHLEGNLRKTYNLFVTDSHDLETMILSSPALGKVLRELELNSPSGDALLSETLEKSSVLAYLRWISESDGLYLTFDGLRIEDIDAELTARNIRQIIYLLKVRSKMCNASVATIHARYQEISCDPHDLWLLCCGHDVVAIMAFILASKHGRRLHPEILEQNLRLAYEFDHFRSTQLYHDIQDWETANPQFKVFRTVS